MPFSLLAAINLPVLALAQVALLVDLQSARLNPEVAIPGMLAQAQQLSDPRKAEARRLLRQGLEQYQANQLDAALQSWEQALRLYQQLKDRQGEGSALNNLGLAYYFLGNYGKALEFHQQRLAIARELGDRRSEGQALGNLGLAYSGLGDFNKAKEYHQQSLAIARDIGDRQSEGQALGNLGLTYTVLGNYSRALQVQQESLEIFRALGNRLDEGLAFGSLGLTYYYLGDYPKAVHYQQQSLAIAREVKNRQGEGEALGNLGNAYYFLADYRKALEYQQHSLAIAREVKDRLGEGQALGSLGVVYLALGDYPKVIEAQQQRLAIARQLKDRLGEGQALGALGIAYLAQGKPAQAIESQQQMLAIVRQVNNRLGEATALNNLGIALFRSGQLAEAERRLFESIQVYESLRQGLADTQKVSIADIQRNPYNNLKRVLVAQNKVEAALEIAERGRARAFTELLARRTQGKEPLTPPPIQIAAIRQIAREQRATLVQYANLNDEQLLIWVVQPTGEVALRQVDLTPLREQQTSLDNLVIAARCLGIPGCETAVAARGSQRIAFNVTASERQVEQLAMTLTQNPYLQRLHQLLIAPIADLLPAAPQAQVIFIPQGQLFLLPFAILQDDQGKYLIETHTIAIAPSIQVLQLTRQHRQRQAAPTGDSLLVGNPLMPRVAPRPGEPAQQLAALPGAEAEVQAIAHHLQRPALIGKQATETVVRQRMPEARIIHLATHGLLGDFGDSGIPGAIALAPDGSHDGLLTANDLLELQLQADLVVLSACDTGLGRITGDGVIGLSRSLITAGVPSVIVSLWAVPDAPTADLMTRFYTYLNQGQDKAQALRQAMLETKQVHPDPRAWAAFTLIGESESL